MVSRCRCGIETCAPVSRRLAACEQTDGYVLAVRHGTVAVGARNASTAHRPLDADFHWATMLFAGTNNGFASSDSLPGLQLLETGDRCIPFRRQRSRTQDAYLKASQPYA